MSSERYITPTETESRSPDAERISRLEKQESAVPPVLAVRDRELIRLLAIAGAGGSY